jgi:hypothetical protein
MKKVRIIYVRISRSAWSVIWRIVDKWVAFRNRFYPVIYYEYFSRDCDMCEVTYVRSFEGGKKRFLEMCERSYEGAEGPMSFTTISKEEYEERRGERHIRDRVMENYENGGNGYFV